MMSIQQTVKSPKQKNLTKFDLAQSMDAIKSLSVKSSDTKYHMTGKCSTPFDHTIKLESRWS